ncbi:MAG: hypothetical protein ACOC85_04265 [Thermoplasmatota archaeon]
MILYILLTLVLMFIFHEVLHYVPLLIFGISFDNFIISKKSIGFIVDNSYLKDNKKLFISFLLPLSLSLVYSLDRFNLYLFVFSFTNALWSFGDLVTLGTIIKKSSDDRVGWADNWDKKALKQTLFSIELG